MVRWRLEPAQVGVITVTDVSRAGVGDAPQQSLAPHTWSVTRLWGTAADAATEPCTVCPGNTVLGFVKVITKVREHDTSHRTKIY